MKNFSIFLFIISFAFSFIAPDIAYSADNNSAVGYTRGKGPVGVFHPEDYVDVDDPKSLWYGYGKNVSRDYDVSNVGVPIDSSIISKNYNPKAVPHVKGIAKYCNQQWRNQKCLKTISSLAVELTKDYMKKIYYSKKVSGDLKAPSQKFLRENCAGILIKIKEEIIPDVMSDNLKKCLNTINYVSKKTEAYPDRDLRQLAMGASFCIVRQPQCQVIEKQLLLVAKPKVQEASQSAPVIDKK